MKKYILLLCAFFYSATILYAQNGLMVAGAVMDESGEVLIGVSVVEKANKSNGTITDLDGKFRLKNLSPKSVILFSYIGYKPFEYRVTTGKENIKVILEPDVNKLDEVVVTGRSTQRKISVVGAVTNIAPAGLDAPATSVTNMLGGRVPGIIAVTRSGEPGDDFSEFWIRGISTFGANQSALVLVDGVEGNLNDLDPADIESFTVLKDASATAVYGVRGANGVVVVTTNRGKAGKLNINFKTNMTLSQSGRMPEYADAAMYTTLANEARMARGLDPKYSDVELELFRTGLDPDLYPNVNWRDEILKDKVFNNQHFLSISGGGQNARFYVSLGIQNKDAVFKQDKAANKYNTNVTYHKYSFRANVDANLTKTTTLSLGLEQVIVNQNSPALGDNNDVLWGAQANLTPVSIPVRYSNGQLPAYGKNTDQYSPYVLLNQKGYTQKERSASKLNVGLRQELDFITKGLSVEGRFAYTGNNIKNIERSKTPDLYYAYGRLSDGTLDTRRTVSKVDLNYGKYVENDRQYYYEFRSDYNRVFGDHRVTGLLHYYMQDFTTSKAGDNLSAIPKRYQALSGRATYSYKDTYLIEGNVGYTGSENFKKGEQFGWFPSIAAGWTPSQYKWFQKALPFINYLKFRGSYGEVGQDKIIVGGNEKRFPYLTTITGAGNGGWGGNGITEGEVGTDHLVWETAQKYNFGIDAQFFNDKINVTVDFFKDKRTGIFQQRATIPEEAGMEKIPWANVGSMESHGVDGNITFTQQMGKDWLLTLRANMTYSANEVTNWEQSEVRYPYQSYNGVPYGVLRGLVAVGLFEDESDIESSPVQTFEKEVLPGDIKYRDINGDGKIDSDDEVPLSYSNTPQIQYGFATELKWKNWTLSALFEGTGKVNFFYGGTGFYPFAWGATGNILEIVADQNNRWTPEEISGTKATENPNARFPRMTYGENKNNNRNSTYWLADASYLRLKNLEVSYRFAHPWLRNTLGVEGITGSLIGTNLACWDGVKLWDPGQVNGNGAKYPIQRTFTFQLNVKF